ncbi:MAG TPA: dihydropyrimidinase [Anaerolineae bacterium]|nr:dihydropyrimidinase [Anaerolineae bacterium]
MNTLIQNGTIITASDTIQADVLIAGEKIALLGRDLNPANATVIDATGKYLLPGGIDVHTHLELYVAGTVSSDDFYTGHKAAAFGGTTAHIDFANQAKGESLHQALEKWRKRAQGKAVIDYGFHVTITDLTAEALAEIPTLVDEGVSTLKLLMAYKGTFQVDDTTLFKTLLKAAEAGMLVMVHCENGDAIDVLIKQAVAQKHLDPLYHPRTRPAWAEAEATLRAIALAAIAGAPLYVVHMTCEASLDQLRYARARGLPVMGETCTQYLFFTEDDIAKPDGAKYVCSPPLRTRHDNKALWRALADGGLQVVSTDHCPFFFDGTKDIEYEGRKVKIPGKELGRGDFTKLPNGVPGLQDRLPILWNEGVNTGRLSPNRFVELTATNPAKIFGLYPRKGTLAVGSDADIVIWDPALKKTMGVKTSHQRTDYNLYEGWEVTGWPEKVFVRGDLLVDGERWLGEPGRGAYLRRNAPATII